MTNTEQTFFEQALGFSKAWKISHLKIDKSKREAHIYLEYTLPHYEDPQTGEQSKIYDYRPERHA